MTTIAEASEMIEEEDGELKLKEPIESQMTKRLKEIYKENREYAKFLIEHGYFFLGMEEPDEDIKELVEEGKIPDEDTYCFSVSQYAVKEVDRLLYVEGWVDDGSTVLRHGFCYDKEEGAVIDLSVWNSERMEEMGESKRKEAYKGVHYLGLLI